jgi:hypothetical protein
MRKHFFAISILRQAPGVDNVEFFAAEKSVQRFAYVHGDHFPGLGPIL